MLAWDAKIGGMVDYSATKADYSGGVDVSCDPAANTKGAWTLVASPTTRWGSCVVGARPTGGSSDFLFDIGKSDDGVNVSIVVPDLHAPQFNNRTGGIAAALPLAAEAGVDLYVRAQSHQVNDILTVSLMGGPGLMGNPGFQRAVDLYTPATSRGVTVDPGATANTKGAWTQLSAGVGQRIGAVSFVIGDAAVTTTRTAAMTWLLDIGVGASGAQQVLLGNIGFANNVNFFTLLPHVHGPFPCDLPPNTAVWARAQCSAATASTRTFDLSAWGWVP